MRLVYSFHAARDLQSIRRFSEQRWGTRRTERYLEEIDVTIKKVLKGVQQGRRVVFVTSPLERVLSGRHHIYFTKANGILHISRVLHGSMNMEQAYFPDLREDS